jgi:FKBP-type peptidyl-prolyl cis-trans isomerase SlyD
MSRSRRLAPALLAVAGLALVLGAATTSRAFEDDERRAAPELEPIGEAQEVQPGAVVHLEFTLWDQEGAVLDTTRGKAPLVFTQGAGEIIPGLERALAGMRVGEAKRVTVPPEDAYGPVDATAVTEVPKAQVPPEALAVGARLRGQTRSGREMPVRVREIKDTTVVLDLNHPLAGRTLVFDVRVILIEPPP